jgi:type I restriction-modification system DNA methylase subunit
LFIGKKDQKGYVLIPEFGGEIFAPDEVLDSLNVDDVILKDDLLKLSKYDFNTDVDVNILGHIFEHSLSEIEEVEAELKGEVADKTKGKRKKDGVFYTPKYITKYIVENTIGKLCSDKKTEFKLDVDVNIFEYQKADGKLNSKGIALYETLNQYKAWLLTLKILDPACGSGAFLNQAVNFLIHEHQFIDDIISELTNTPLRLYDTDIAILENNIYGVDINEESVEIAKLSLWLRTAKQGRKLSNLSNNIKCGNSLIDDPVVAGDKAFNWQKEFPEVFAKGGFDVVIGNPPYINIYNMNSSDRDYFNLSDDYTTTYLKYDIYVLFVEKAINLLKKNGIMSYIIPSVILSIPYGKIIREKIIKENTLNQIIDFTGFKVFSDAMVESCILLISKNTSENNLVKIFKPKLIVTDFQSDNILINQNEFLKTDSFQFRLELNNNSLLIIDKIKKLSVSLESIYYVSKGIVAFSKIDNRKKDDFIFNEKIDEKCYPYLEGKDVNRYYIRFENKYLQYDVNIMSRPTFPELHNKNKLLIRAISDGLNATYDDNGYYIDQKLIICSKRFEIENYIIPSKRPKSEHLNSKNVINDLAILALLNSKLSSFYYNKMYKGGVSILPEDVRNFTIYLFKTKEEQQPFVDKADSMLSLNKEIQDHSLKFQRSLVRKFAFTELPKKLQDWYLLSYAEFIKELEKKKIKLSLSEEAEWETYFTTEAQKVLGLKSQIEKTDKEIDQMVYALYELSEDEIKIIEES